MIRRSPFFPAARLFACAAACLALALAVPAVHAGGEMGDPDDHHDDDGLAIFGFVKDANGKAIVDAKVVAEAKGTRMVVRSSAVGLYRFSNFDKQVTADDVVISCGKDGYKQSRILKKPRPVNPSIRAVEIECRLQAG